MTRHRGLRIAGWIVSILVGLMLLGPSAGGKLIAWDGKEEAFAHLGWTIERMNWIAGVEIGCAILFLMPFRTLALLGTILLTAYLGGAVCTHVRIGEPWFMPVIIGVVAWFGYGLRWPAFFRHLLGTDGAATTGD